MKQLEKETELDKQIAKENRGKNLIIGDLIRPMIPFTRKNF